MSTSNTRTCPRQLKLCDKLHVIRLSESDKSAEEVCTARRVSPTLLLRIIETLHLYENPDSKSVSRQNITLGIKYPSYTRTKNRVTLISC